MILGTEWKSLKMKESVIVEIPVTYKSWWQNVYLKPAPSC